MSAEAYTGATVSPHAAAEIKVYHQPQSPAMETMLLRAEIARQTELLEKILEQLTTMNARSEREPVQEKLPATPPRASNSTAAPPAPQDVDVEPCPAESIEDIIKKAHKVTQDAAAVTKAVGKVVPKKGAK